MANFFGLVGDIESFIPFLRTFFTVIIVYLIFSFLLGIIKKRLLEKAKTKRQISNVEIFSKLFRYVTLFILIISAFFSYTGSWTGLGLTVGLLSAAIGFALQKPITGIAAWIMIIAKRPFEIGDRVIIGNVKGDVEDITLTHIYLKEVGGIVPSEESSGRTIMIPNSILFEQNIINYTLQDDYVLNQVVATVTYESNLDRAIQIALESAEEHTKKFRKEIKEKPYTRISFAPSGIDIHVRYFAPAAKIQGTSSKITKEIYERVIKTDDVEFAYPHTEVLFKEKPPAR